MSNLIISGGLSSVRVLGKSVEPVAMVEPASTFTGVTVSDNGGKVRLTGAGSHGITAAISVTPGLPSLANIVQRLNRYSVELI